MYQRSNPKEYQGTFKQKKFSDRSNYDIHPFYDDKDQVGEHRALWFDSPRCPISPNLLNPYPDRSNKN